MQPGDFKRKYKFRSSTRNERRNINIAIIISIIAFLLIYFL
jgi:hypothetical protein